MKIGIMTFWESQDNYGQILQCYALQKFLRNKGHDAFLIKFRRISKKNNLIKRIWLFISKNIWDINYYKQRRLSTEFRRLNSIQGEENKKHPRHFESFKKKYIKSTEKIYNQFDIKENPPKADVYIAGSDQIWNGLNAEYFLDFVPKDKIKIAYAASGLPSNAGKEYAKGLSNFDIITVRESSSVKICEKLGFDNIKVVPDPTFLLEPEEYPFEFHTPEDEDFKRPYLLIYLLGNKMNYNIDDVLTWASNKNLEVKFVASNGYSDQNVKIYPKIEDWIALIKNAKYIVTNSFHGMVFSIIMNKKFMVIPLCDEFSQMNYRLNSTLGFLGLENRILNSSLEVIQDDIDYGKVNRILSNQRISIGELMDEWLKLSK